MKKLAKWAAESKLDPNDPSNAPLMQLISVMWQENCAHALSRLGRTVLEIAYTLHTCCSHHAVVCNNDMSAGLNGRFKFQPFPCLPV